jgi:hypothetical protein
MIRSGLGPSVSPTLGVIGQPEEEQAPVLRVESSGLRIYGGG